ncbi:MAG: DMT family transporter [Clostridia bacterium]|nr:DMT family transporter [Clostridia bacterium]
MNRQLKADLLLVTVAFFWGSTFILVQQAISEIPVYTFLASRFILAFLVLSLIFFKRLLKINIRTFLYSAIVGMVTFLGYVFQTLGLKYTTASKAGFITGLTVVLVPIMSSVLVKEKPKFNSILGVLFALSGLMLITLNAEYSINKGDMYTLICAFCFAASILLIDKYTVSVDSISLAIMQIGVIATLSTIFAFVFEDVNIKFTINTITALVITGIFATAYALVIQNMMQRYTTPTHTALIFSLEPVFGAVFAYLIADETFTLKTLIGCILILIGMIISEVDFKHINNMRYIIKRDDPSSHPS